MWYAFEVYDGRYNQQGREYRHWVVTERYDTKKQVMETFNKRGYARKVKKVYTLEQLYKEYGLKETKRILEETKKHWEFKK